MPVATRNHEEIAKEIEDLEDLIKSEGWGVFSQRILDEWQNAGFMTQTANALKASDPLVEVKAVQKTAVNLLGLIDWPKARIQYLRGLKT